MEKHRASVFFETTLDTKLRMLGVEQLIISGCNTEFCVETTIRDGYYRDMDIIVVRDCVAGPRPRFHGDTLAKVRPTSARWSRSTSSRSDHASHRGGEWRRGRGAGMTRASAGIRLRLDPSTFEIVRHRLWYINDEGALTIARLSGSPVATEVFDMNAGLMTAAGDLVYIDNFICAQATTLGPLVKHLLEEYPDNPGFGRTTSSSATTRTSPYATRTVSGWRARSSMGTTSWPGPGPPFMRSTWRADCGPGAGRRRGHPRRAAADRPGEGVRGRSLPKGRRTLEQLPAAGHPRSRPTGEGCGGPGHPAPAAPGLSEFGRDTVLAAMEDVIDYTEGRLRARLEELPDGVWRHRGYIEFGDDIYECRVTLEKEGGSLRFDFSDSSGQAPAVINCAYPGLVGGVLASVMVYLCWDMPWSPAGVLRTIEIESRPGTLIHAEYPAGVSKSTTTSIWEVRNLAQHHNREDARGQRTSPRSRDGRMARGKGPGGTLRLRARGGAIRRSPA